MAINFILSFFNQLRNLWRRWRRYMKIKYDSWFLFSFIIFAFRSFVFSLFAFLILFRFIYLSSDWEIYFSLLRYFPPSGFFPSRDPKVLLLSLYGGGFSCSTFGRSGIGGSKVSSSANVSAKSLVYTSKSSLSVSLSSFSIFE